ncbi:hypothetical protein DFJ58DRAFT_451399 [Suillus subalutaceus]|uniref:uncharacterized protein n=1 Tax=Suillus subalutaceus TaxID=48586 RepID=UPI001B86CE51|nr:uncharacterized protein DFJ58DRAFT_451399 [Suillus subalutaceus]KAG1849427.1 hypothetical protein DFJ58DRAFT_451399 [Suillus subalutaceus]
MSDSPAPCVPIATNLDTSFGPLLGSIWLAFMFYGANCLQIFVYFINYPKDRMALKVIVIVIWLFDTAHQILGSIGIWQYLVSNYGNYVFLSGTHPPLLIALVFSSMVSTIAQLFFTYRIWHLSGGHWAFPAFLIPAALSQLVLCCLYAAKGLANNTVQNLYDLTKYSTAANALAAGTDTIIAIIMCTLLARGKAGFNKKTDAILARLIILSVNCGLWTGAFALAVSIMNTAMPDNLVYTWPQFSLSPLYCNTVLGCLNARGFIRDGMQANQRFHLGSTSGRKLQHPLNVAVETRRTVENESVDSQTLQVSSKDKQTNHSTEVSLRPLDERYC